MTPTFRQKRTLLKEGIKKINFLIEQEQKLLTIITVDNCNVCEIASKYKEDPLLAACVQVCGHTIIRHLCAELYTVSESLICEINTHLDKMTSIKFELELALQNLIRRYYSKKEKQ